MFCDLHTHSTSSDGTTPPNQLPILAASADLKAIALTDHDTTEGLADCASACVAAGIAFVPGVEVSADPALRSPNTTSQDEGYRRGTLHILGLFIRHDDSKLLCVHKRMRKARESRNPAIIDKLNDLGVNVRYDEVVELANQQGTKIIGRPHIAQLLIRKGYVKSIQNAFTQYIGQDGPAYVRRDRLTAAEAIDAIHHAGGLAILAHPVQLGLHDPDELEHFLVRIKDIGLDGIETRHSNHDAILTHQYERLAKKLSLLTSGGSDFHGAAKSVTLGSQRVPLSVFEKLRRAAAQ